MALIHRAPKPVFRELRGISGPEPQRMEGRFPQPLEWHKNDMMQENPTQLEKIYLKICLFPSCHEISFSLSVLTTHVQPSCHPAQWPSQTETVALRATVGTTVNDGSRAAELDFQLEMERGSKFRSFFWRVTKVTPCSSNFLRSKAAKRPRL